MTAISSFRTWTGESTHYARDGGKPLMNNWAEFVNCTLNVRSGKAI